ncbi:MAG: hypothetical protein U0V74_11070 [Chitinophagales bacterium]
MKNIIPFLLVLLVISSCNPFGRNYNAQKLSNNDPFKTTMVPSEFFIVNADEETVIEGVNGTMVAIPKNAFIDKQGNAATGKVRIELAEAYSLSSQLLSNITSTIENKPMLNAGTLYLNATNEKGEPLTLDKNKPTLIRMPVKNKSAGAKLYRGERNDNGSMSWDNARETENYLVPIDIHQLNFLPDGFAEVVRGGLPFNGYTVSTPDLVDSLYYSLSAYKYFGEESLPEIYLNEAYYNRQIAIENSKYNRESYNTIDSATVYSDKRWTPKREIDPALIKTLKSDSFQNTFIATHEFEKRLQAIFKTCSNDILMLYVNNLDKQLWQVDEMAAKALGEKHRPEKHSLNLRT